MTVSDLAALLDGRESGEEITPEEERAAKDAGLVVVFGASDDLCEFRGVIHDEQGAYGGSKFRLTKYGLVQYPDIHCTHMDCPYILEASAKANEIRAIWRDEGNPCWTYETDIPFLRFRIMEDGELYCVGIVFSVDALA